MQKNRLPNVFLIRIITALFLLSASIVFAGGKKEAKPTELQMSSQPRQYISPAAKDGVQDGLQLPFSDLVLPGTDRVIVSWTFTVFDGSGTVVFQDTKAETKRRTGFAELFKIGEKPKVAVPSELTWDGTYKNGGDKDGQAVDDGEYSYQITITDDKGELAKTPPFGVTVDNNAPSAGEIGADFLIFSPVGKRNKVTIDQSGTREYLWEGVFKDVSGKAVRTFTWKNDTLNISLDKDPVKFTWDGKNDAGNILPEGDYSYELSGTDRAGNKVTKIFGSKIALSVKEAGVAVAVSRPAFSPGVNAINLTFTITDPASLVNWRVSISDKRNTQLVRWYKEGGSTPPTTISFDGKDLSGRVIPDGAYVVNLKTELMNGDTLEAAPAEFTVDTEKPAAFFDADTKPLRTERNQPFYIGGTQREFLDVLLKVSPQDPWTAIIESEDGSRMSGLLADYGLSGDNFQFQWYGTDLNGNLVPDGKYTAWLSGTDAAGNYGESNKVRVTVDTKKYAAKVKPTDFIFAPKKEGMKDTVRITTTAEVPEMVELFGFYIKDSEGKIVRSSEIRNTFGYFDWDGRANSNAYVPDGLYTASLKVLYKNGHTAEASAEPVMVFTVSPRGTLSSNTRTVGTKENPSITFTLKPEQEAAWNLVFVNEDQRKVEVPLKKDNAGDYAFTWDGNDETGKSAPDGLYIVYASGVNKVDLRGETNRLSIKKAVPVEVVEKPPVKTVPDEIKPPIASITIENLPLSPDGDGANEEAVIRLSALKGTDDIESWQVRIFEPHGELFKTFQGKDTPPFRVMWDGKSDSGELVQSGESYPVQFTVRDTMGRVAESHDEILVDILVMKDGDTYRIVIPSIHFAGYSASLFTLKDEKEIQKNLEVLRALAAKLGKFPGYAITIEGHAAYVYWTDLSRRDKEQKEELLPLSKNRAESVKQALQILGIDKDRVSTIGLGGSRPVVPHTDLKNLWKNRRVEFLLKK